MSQGHPDPGTERHRQANHAELEGNLLAPGDFRVTPAGRPVLVLELEHQARCEEPESLPLLELRMPVLVIGEQALAYRSLAPGTPLRVTGRLNQKRWVRDGKVRWGRVELVAMEIRVLHAP
ncbi:MAG: single-stranded DNA-binding protein [Magnetococcales bacterium]|nr:single-stranded DNA-binding protein [Magnetococcales bacterium]